MALTTPGRWAAVLQVARSQRRRRIAGGLTLTVVVGLVAALALALLAGSRRSGSVLDRALARSTPFDVQVTTGMPAADLAALPGVKRAVLNPYLAMRVVRPDGTMSSLINGIGLDWDVVSSVARVVSGHESDGADPLGVVINEAAARMFNVGPGNDLVVRMFGLDQGDSLQAGDFTPSGPMFTFHVMAVYRSLQDLSTDEVTGPTQMGNTSQLIVPNTFYLAHRKEFLTFAPDYLIRLDDPTDLNNFSAAFTTRSNELGLDVGPQSFSYATQAGGDTALRSPIRTETTLLLILGVLTAATAIVAAILLMRADQRGLSTENAALRALGLTRGELALASAVRVVPAAVLGAITAVAAAGAASTFFPVGLGRLTEPTPGIELNVAVLGLGLLGILLAVVTIGFAVGLTGSHRARPPGPPALLAKFNLPLTPTLGARLAFDRGGIGRNARARQAVVVGTVSVALVLGVGVYTAGLHHLHDDRSAHGFPWDAMVGNVNFALNSAQLNDVVSDRNIASSAAVVALEGVMIDGTHLAPLWAEDTSAPSVGFVVLRGRLPRANSEIALGAITQRTLGHDVGDTVQLTVTPDSPATSMTIVGTVLPPSAETEIGAGALMTLDGLAAVAPDQAPQYVVVRLRPDVDRSNAIARLVAHHDNAVTLDARPAQIVNLWRVRWLFLLGGLTVALLGGALVWYILAAAARSRATEIAVLRSLGMTGSGIRKVIIWQGCLLTAATLALGEHVVFFGGAAVWRSIAQHMGVDGRPVLSPLLGLAVPVVGAVTLLAAYVTLGRHRNASVATSLRVE